MKKLPLKLSLVVFAALMWGAFSVPLSLAFTIAHDNEPSPTTWGAPAWPIDGGYFVATGTIGSLYGPVVFDDTSNATSGTQFVAYLYDGSGTQKNCQTAPFSKDSLALANRTTYSPAQAMANPSSTFRTLGPFTGSDCDLSQFSNLSGWMVRVPLPNIGGLVGGIAIPFLSGSTSTAPPIDRFFLLTTDTASSSLYAYQATIVATATSSNATYCDATFPTGSLGVDFANGMCKVAAFLFVPDSGSLQQFSTLQATLSAKFPFSYVSSVASTWDTLVASSTANAPVFSYNLHDLGIGSTTPLGNFLPNEVVLSSSTVEQYDTVGAIPTLKTLAGFAIIMVLIADIFFTSRNLIHH